MWTIFCLRKTCFTIRAQVTSILLVSPSDQMYFSLLTFWLLWRHLSKSSKKTLWLDLNSCPTSKSFSSSFHHRYPQFNQCNRMPKMSKVLAKCWVQCLQPCLLWVLRCYSTHRDPTKELCTCPPWALLRLNGLQNPGFRSAKPNLHTLEIYSVQIYRHRLASVMILSRDFSLFSSLSNEFKILPTKHHSLFTTQS